MRDVVYILITVAFFAICVGLVRACDVLLGPDEEDLNEVPSEAGHESVEPVGVGS